LYCHSKNRAPVTEHGLCTWCERRGHFTIVDLARDYVELRNELVPGIAQGGTPSRVLRVDAPLPLRMDVDEQMRNIHWVFREWSGHVRKVMSMTPIGHMAHGHVVAIATATLRDSYPVLLSLRDVEYEDYWTGDILAGDGADAVIQLMDAHVRARRLLGLARTWEERKMPCPSEPLGNGCGRWTLGTWVGSGIVECRSCSWSCSQSDYERYVFTMVPAGRR